VRELVEKRCVVSPVTGERCRAAECVFRRHLDMIGRGPEKRPVSAVIDACAGSADRRSIRYHSLRFARSRTLA